MTTRTIRATAALGALALALPAAAGAHISAFPEELPADGYAKLDFRVPHGCEESPTRRITVRMPDAVTSATPQEVAGWRVTTREGRLPAPVTADGETITEGVREATWTATGRPLASDRLQEFGLSVRVQGAPGSDAWFRILQECVEGETAWAEIPVAGEPEPEAPAAGVRLVAAESGRAEPVAAPAGADDEDGAPMWLGVAGLAFGALGLGAGTAGLLAGRRRR